MIPLFYCNASGATICSLDDPAVDTDLGSAFTASVVSTQFAAQPPQGFSRLRRLSQVVSIGTSATIKLTPIADDSENPDDAQTSGFTSVTDGATPTAVAHTANPGSRFQVKTEVTAHVGKCELGEAEQLVVPRRSLR